MYSLLLLVSLSVVQDPAPPLDVPAPKPGKVGRYIGLKAETKGEVVLWRALSPGLDFLDPIFAPKDSKVTGVIADVPGTYKVLAITSVDNKPYMVEVEVIFEGKEPPPPPKPPVPPGPQDELGKKLQAAFSGDLAPASVKNGQKIMLIGMYEAMAEHAKSQTILTTGQLMADMQKLAPQMIAANGLLECRKVVSAELAMALGTDPAAKLDPDLRPKAVDVFTRIAKALGDVK